LLQRCLDDFERFLNTPSSLPNIIKYAITHYQFEAIHPFEDGNGRVGRLLIPLQMISDGLLTQPLLYLSAFFERNRPLYYDSLMDVSLRGAWRSWIDFVLTGIEQEAEDSAKRASALLAMRERYRKASIGVRSAGMHGLLVDHLFQSPMVTIASAAKILGVTEPTAKKVIDRMIVIGALTEFTGRQRGRLYMASEILDLTNAPSMASWNSRGGKDELHVLE